jgi:hypothetical protein
MDMVESSLAETVQEEEAAPAAPGSAAGDRGGVNKERPRGDVAAGYGTVVRKLCSATSDLLQG